MYIVVIRLLRFSFYSLFNVFFLSVLFFSSMFSALHPITKKTTILSKYYSNMTLIRDYSTPVSIGKKKQGTFNNEANCQNFCQDTIAEVLSHSYTSTDYIKLKKSSLFRVEVVLLVIDICYCRKQCKLFRIKVTFKVCNLL